MSPLLYKETRKKWKQGGEESKGWGGKVLGAVELGWTQKILTAEQECLFVVGLV